MNVPMLAPALPMTALSPLDHVATLQQLAKLALTRHQQQVAQPTAAGRPPRLIFLRSALRCATWLTRYAQRQEAPAAVSILVPLVPVLAAVASAVAAADAQDEASATYSGQPLALWITCVTKQTQVDDLLAWARDELVQPEPVAPVTPSAPDLAALDARLAALIKQSALLVGENWDDLLEGDDEMVALTG